MKKSESGEKVQVKKAGLVTKTMSVHKSRKGKKPKITRAGRLKYITVIPVELSN